jgi:hypothetical protein
MKLVRATVESLIVERPKPTTERPQVTLQSGALRGHDLDR